MSASEKVRVRRDGLPTGPSGSLQTIDGVVFGPATLRRLERLGNHLRAMGVTDVAAVAALKDQALLAICPPDLLTTVRRGCDRRVLPVIAAMFPNGETQCLHCGLMKPNTDFIDRHGEVKTRCIACRMSAYQASRPNGGVLNTPSPENDPVRQPGPVVIVRPAERPAAPPQPRNVAPIAARPTTSPAPAAAPTAVCTKCGQTKPTSDFYTDRSKPTGIRSDCKVCNNAVRAYGKATKACSSCKERKPISQFGRDKNRPDGHGPECKECHKNRMAAYRRGVKSGARPVPPGWVSKAESAAPTPEPVNPPAPMSDRLALAHLIVEEDEKVETARRRMEEAKVALFAANDDFERALKARDEALGLMV